MFDVAPATRRDLPQTARLHERYLRLGLFPRLGRKFLARYQECFIDSPYGIALVARGEGEVVGALFATASNAEHYNWVVRNRGLALALTGAASMAVRPGVAVGFVRTRLGRYSGAILRRLAPGLAPKADEPRTGGKRLSVLSHIVIAKGLRRQGIGRKLVAAYKKQARRLGARRAVLITEEGGEGSPFFERIGCTLVSARPGQDGAQVREYQLTLKETDKRHEKIAADRRGRLFLRSYRRRNGGRGRLAHSGTGAT